MIFLVADSVFFTGIGCCIFWLYERRLRRLVNAICEF